ncbi:hypothetical protein G6N05_12645 [Flavobacterium sp. F372]|jgi:hypothetical protein|uniref:DUF3278 domain-containing protein n=1 Tax=Flavobacterium bernardetii TaxID=2813823 RepID=A0ABR7J0K4_9FLAO|nr:hypothetical protein [Flavobacterium bernardetii]MBC5835596.1 hypothetical protein [Flavobacterium bernardetii]NHF70960.1 hypothetical protein [Flavobacterium bernardetii]
MDFNDMQNAWNNDTNENIKLPENLEKIQSANTPLDKIRKNLRNEFFYQIISIVLIGFLPVMNDFPSTMVKPFYLLFSMFVAVSIYYLVKLYLFYKRLNNVSLNTKDSLYETYFDIRLNMELYKTFGFALTPFMVLFIVGAGYYQWSKSGEIVLSNLHNSHFIGLFVVVAIFILFMGLALEWWVQYFYGKYAKEIRKVIDELKED